MVNPVAHPGDVVLVTGGSGFVGSHIVRMLVKKGHDVAEVRIFDIREPLEPIRTSDSDLGLTVSVRYVQGDVRDMEALRQACRGVNAVLHVAAALDTGLEPDVEHLHAVNVTGTENVIQACREANIEYLIYTSSSEVLRGFGPRENATEEDVDNGPVVDAQDLVFPTYSITKKLAEDAVLAANGRQLSNGKTLHTLALRPCGVYGEHDVTFVTGFLRTGKTTGVLPILGSADVKVSKIYAGNVAWAHVHALNAMRVQENTVRTTDRKGNICGRAYHVTDATSKENTYVWIKPFLETQRIKVLPVAIPLWLVYYFWLVLEAFVCLLAPLVRIPLAANHNELYLSGTTSTYDGSLAKTLLGYTPIYSPKQAYKRSASYYSQLKL